MTNNRPNPGQLLIYDTPCSCRILLSLPQFILDAATDAAWSARVTRSEWIRRAVLAALDAEAGGRAGP